MENREEIISNLDRKVLVEIGKKLEIKGRKNNFSTPYLKKEVLRSYILNILKNKNQPVDKKTENRLLFTYAKKLVAIGDIHGDLTSDIKSLKLGGVISKSFSIIPKTLMI